MGYEICLGIKQFQPSVSFNIETSNLICTANERTGFYMKCNTRLKWVKHLKLGWCKSDIYVTIFLGNYVVEADTEKCQKW